MGDLGETWSEVTGAAGAEAAARSYEHMVKTWIMVDLGETWGEVAQAAGAAEAAARTYQRAKDDPALSEEERIHARDQYKEAAKRLDGALRSAKVREQDGLWSEVMDAAQRAQTAGHAFLSAKHDLERPESERREAKKAYGRAKSRVASLVLELKITPTPEAAVSEQGAKEPEPAETPEDVPETPESSGGEPAAAVSEESMPGSQSAEASAEVSEPTNAAEGQQEEPEGSGPPSWDGGSN